MKCPRLNVLALVILYFDITLGLNRIFNDDYFTAQLIVIFTMYGNIQPYTANSEIHSYINERLLETKFQFIHG